MHALLHCSCFFALIIAASEKTTVHTGQVRGSRRPQGSLAIRPFFVFRQRELTPLPVNPPTFLVHVAIVHAEFGATLIVDLGPDSRKISHSWPKFASRGSALDARRKCPSHRITSEMKIPTRLVGVHFVYAGIIRTTALRVASRHQFQNFHAKLLKLHPPLLPVSLGGAAKKKPNSSKGSLNCFACSALKGNAVKIQAPHHGDPVSVISHGVLQKQRLTSTLRKWLMPNKFSPHKRSMKRQWSWW